MRGRIPTERLPYNNTKQHCFFKDIFQFSFFLGQLVFQGPIKLQAFLQFHFIFSAHVLLPPRVKLCSGKFNQSPCATNTAAQR